MKAFGSGYLGLGKKCKAFGLGHLGFGLKYKILYFAAVGLGKKYKAFAPGHLGFGKRYKVFTASYLALYFGYIACGNLLKAFVMSLRGLRRGRRQAVAISYSYGQTESRLMRLPRLAPLPTPQASQ
jgi:hypothetical protein